jgi:uncharacterized protein (TIGR04255 family)
MVAITLASHTGRPNLMVRRYKNSPIIEALCEIQFEPDSTWDLTVPGLVYERLRDSFPERRQAKVLGVAISPSAEEATVEQQVWATDRMHFVRQDGTALVQIGPHFLAVNHLRPYRSWHDFLPMIQNAFAAYRDVAAPTGIHRVSLRYINRIEFPARTVKLEDYFAFYPFVGPELPQDYSAFLVGIQVPYEDTQAILQMQSASVGAEVPDTIAMILDLAYSLAKPGEVSLDTVFKWIDTGHKRIDETFEAAITERLRKRFEEISE